MKSALILAFLTWLVMVLHIKGEFEDGRAGLTLQAWEYLVGMVLAYLAGMSMGDWIKKDNEELSNV